MCPVDEKRMIVSLDMSQMVTTFAITLFLLVLSTDNL